MSIIFLISVFHKRQCVQYCRIFTAIFFSCCKRWSDGRSFRREGSKKELTFVGRYEPCLHTATHLRFFAAILKLSDRYLQSLHDRGKLKATLPQQWIRKLMKCQLQRQSIHSVNDQQFLLQWASPWQHSHSEQRIWVAFGEIIAVWTQMHYYCWSYRKSFANRSSLRLKCIFIVEFEAGRSTSTMW